MLHDGTAPHWPLAFPLLSFDGTRESVTIESTLSTSCFFCMASSDAIIPIHLTSYFAYSPRRVWVQLYFGGPYGAISRYS